ncbi:MAG: right-handed parallel beta-helix repeat-containing protein [Thermoanaerobaculia bacterium]|nr:right-handed parallel beta-helix repeat-containing protein [Thermoanaerobaculia bacterium]
MSAPAQRTLLDGPGRALAGSHRALALGLVAVFCGWLAAVPDAYGFPYRGEIRLGGSSVDGRLDVMFTVYDAAEGGRAVAEPYMAEGVSVDDDDSFTVDVRFGPITHAGELWLEVHVLKAGELGPFEALKPRRQLFRSAVGELSLRTMPSPGRNAAARTRASYPPGPAGTLRRDLSSRVPGGGTAGSDLAALRAAASASVVPGAGLPDTGLSDPSGILVRDLSALDKAGSAALYSELGWQGSSGADLSNFSAGDNVLRITEDATSNVFEVDFGHIVPGTRITGLPITVNEPGHYYLVGNLSNTVNNADGIVIDTDNVTIDMNGYTLYGEIFTGINSDDGIVVLGSQTNIKIYNGSVVGWGGDGINALNADFSIYKDLHVSNNEGDGLVTDFNGVMERVTAFSNGLDGIEGDDGSIIFNCTAGQNDDNGIQVSEGSVVVDSASYDNRVDGFDIAAGGVVKNCAASDNGVFGFDVALGGQAVESTAYDNVSNGFDMASACILRSCISSENQGHGVRTFANSWITDSKFHGNTFEGIRISSTDCHAEGNQVTGNGRTGLLATSSGSFIVRNTAHGNMTNFGIDPNCAFGPIVDVAGIGNLTNNAAASHPWANFSF